MPSVADNILVVIAQNQLQAEVIALQRLVIETLQDIHSNGRPPTRKEYMRLMNATDAACAGPVAALRGQHRRLIEAPSVVAPPQRRITERRVSLDVIPFSDRDADPLYCGYALDLQRNPNKLLSPSFDIGGKQRCPSCGTRFDLLHGHAWKITKDVLHPARLGHDRRTPDFEYRVPALAVQELEEVTFHVMNRFIVKCHREDGEFACVLCNRNRPADTIWGSMSELVKHVQRAHDVAEYEREVDIREVA